MIINLNENDNNTFRTPEDVLRMKDYPNISVNDIIILNRVVADFLNTRAKSGSHSLTLKPEGRLVNANLNSKIVIKGWAIPKDKKINLILLENGNILDFNKLNLTSEKFLRMRVLPESWFDYSLSKGYDLLEDVGINGIERILLSKLVQTYVPFF